MGISLEAGVSNRELMITVMDMETSYVIVVYSNDISFTTSVHTGLTSYIPHISPLTPEPTDFHSDKFELIRSQLM